MIVTNDRAVLPAVFENCSPEFSEMEILRRGGSEIGVLGGIGP